MSDVPTTIDGYLSKIDPAFRAELQRIRELVLHLVPEAEESISYRMPTLKYRDRPLVFFTTSKKHMSFYPSSWAIEKFRDRLEHYKTSEHAIQFTLENPLPDDLVEDLVRCHVREIESGRQ